MRKSVLFLVGILYLVSIVVVTFFGMQARMDQFKVYVSSVEIINDGMGEFEDENGNKHKKILIRFPSKEATEVTFNVQTKVLPENATDKSLTYTLRDVNGKLVSEDVARILSDGRLSIAKSSKPGDIVIFVIVTAADGSNKSDTLKITCRAAK